MYSIYIYIYTHIHININIDQAVDHEAAEGEGLELLKII